MLGLLGLQIWCSEQQLARQKAEIARQKVVQEQEFAKQEADFELWQAQTKARPGQPVMPLPMPPPLPPPVISQTPMIPLIPGLFPVLFAPLWLVAVAEQQRLQKLQHQEEEERTPYTDEELMQNWEFKIIRNPRGLFDQPAFLESVLQEEARAGWRFVGKFDGTRVRLKRIAEHQPAASDLPPGYDPYRTTVGPKPRYYLLLWLLCILCLVLVAVFIVAQVFDPISPVAFGVLLALTGGGTIASGLLAANQ
jgi:hypothetical protein